MNAQLQEKIYKLQKFGKHQELFYAATIFEMIDPKKFVSLAQLQEVLNYKSEEMVYKIFKKFRYLGMGEYIPKFVTPKKFAEISANDKWDGVLREHKKVFENKTTVTKSDYYGKDSYLEKFENSNKTFVEEENENIIYHRPEIKTSANAARLLKKIGEK